MQHKDGSKISKILPESNLYLVEGARVKQQIRVTLREKGSKGRIRVVRKGAKRLRMKITRDSNSKKTIC
jgi:hypothetical protein